jgi:hypothetical protein
MPDCFLNDTVGLNYLLQTLNNKFMNTKNFEFLKDGLKYMGFGDKLVPELEAKINEQERCCSREGGLLIGFQKIRPDRHVLL